MHDWMLLGETSPQALTDARLQLHWAAQIVSAAGSTYGDPRPDESHTNMAWLAHRGALAGAAIAAGTRQYRAALRLEDLSLLLLDGADEIIQELVLDGCTLDEGFDWLAAAIASYTHGRHDEGLERRDYELPAHAVGDGAAFTAADDDAWLELSRWFGNADLVLRATREANEHASPVRCWPHHFDIATLITLAPGRDPEEAPSIGVGMTPGDSSYSEPYWYVLPWPAPERPDPPPLDGDGRWHRDEWFGAVLPATALVAADSPAAQEQQTRAFIDSAVRAGRELLAASG